MAVPSAGQGGYFRRITALAQQRWAANARAETAAAKEKAGRENTGAHRVSRPSDDPAAWFLVAQIRAERVSFGAQKRSIAEQQRKLNTADDALARVATALDDVGVACLQAANGVGAADRFAAALVAVQKAKGEIKLNLNAKNEEGFVFGGAERHGDPFVFVDAPTPHATYHGTDVHTLAPADVANDATLATATGHVEQQEISFLGHRLSVALCGPSVCGGGKFDFRAGASSAGAPGPLGATEIAGDCYAVVSKIESLLTALAGNAAGLDDSQDLERCSQKIKDIRRTTVARAQRHVWDLQKTLEGLDKTIHERSDQRQELAAELGSSDMLVAQSALVQLSAKESVLDSWRSNLWRLQLRSVDYLSAVGRI
jgi:hypothetical protein